MKMASKWFALVFFCLTACASSIGQVPKKLTPKEIFQKYNDSVVAVETDIKSGSGFFVKNGLLVVTCYHVIKDAKSIQIKGTRGAKWEVGFVYFDEESDTAILKLAEESNRTPIPIGDFSKLETGDDLSVIGSPLGLDQSLTTGIVSARRLSGTVELIQTTAPISPGSSGSPLINSVGQCVGFADFHFTGGQALNMAVSSSSVVHLWAESPIPVATFFVASGVPVVLPRPIKLKATKERLKQLGIEMITIPAGVFTMGSNEQSAEKPIHDVFLDAYSVSKNMITVAQFRAYCQDEEIDFEQFPKPDWGWIDDHPMVRVNWFQARDFCLWAGGNLPTEAQWEKAARGTDRRIYPWGNEFDSNKLWCSRQPPLSPALTTLLVGYFTSGASPYGCLDMAGNAYQWCLDWYDDSGYSRQPNLRNPKGTSLGIDRVIRGGSWYCITPDYFRTAFRDHFGPTSIDDDLGFRLAGHI